MHLRLSFSSLSALDSSSAILAVESAAASAPRALLISINLPFLSPSSSSQSSSSSPSALPWSTLQLLLSRLYSAASRTLLALDLPLTPIDIVIEYLRQLPVCTPDGHQSTTVLINNDDVPSPSSSPPSSSPPPSFPVVALGGTFDHLHPGHKILLTLSAAITSSRLVVGVTAANLLSKKQYADYVESLPDRMQAVRTFLELIRPGVIHDVVPIEDIYGPTGHDPEISALVVSDETRSGGAAVNEERGRRGLSQLEVFVVELLGSGEGEGEGGVQGKMGSTGIREWIAKRRMREKGP